MTVPERLKLIDAGYSRAEIDAMEQPAPAPDPEPEQPPVPAPDPEPEQQPAPAPDPISGRLDALEKHFDRLVTMLQGNNINGRGVPSVGSMSGSEALASLITKKGD